MKKNLTIYSNRWVTVMVQHYPIRQLVSILMGFASILDGMIKVSTFGLVLTNFALRAAKLMIEMDIARQKKIAAKNNSKDSV